MNGKKIVAFALAGVLALSMVSCGAKKEGKQDVGEQKELTVQQVIDRKAYIMGMDDQCMPFGFKDANGTYAGFDLDIAKEIAKRLELTLNLQSAKPDVLMKSLKSGGVDFLANSMTAAKSEGTQKTDTIIKNRQVVVVLSDSEVNDRRQLEGKNVGAVPNSKAAEAISGDSSFQSKIKKVDIKDRNLLLNELTSKKVDAVVVDEAWALYQITNGAAIRVLDKELSKDDYCMIFRDKDKELVKRINEELKAMAKDGTLEKLSTKWFGKNIIAIK
ncbi:MAG: transporter substrate-binding domain-containing protein [Clostridia bacterium]